MPLSAPSVEPAPAASGALPTVSAPSRLPVLRWGLLTALLLAEVMAISMSFDAAARGVDPGWAGTVIVWSPSVLRWSLVVGAAAAALAAWFLGDAVRTAATTRHSPGSVIAWTVAQLAAYAAFAVVTARVLDPGSLDVPLTPVELAAWLGTGALTVICWAAAMMPPRAWARLLWQARYVLLTAGCIGAATNLIAAISREGWEVLSGPTIRAAHAVLRVLTSETVCDPHARILGTPRFLVEVGVPCSGYEGMGLIAAYLSGYLFLFRRELRFPHALSLLPLGLAAIWVVNVFRIAILIVIGDRISPKLAVGGFHSQAGWLGFNLIALTLVYCTHRFHLFAKESVSRGRTGHPTAAYLSPLLAAVAVWMLTTAFASDPAALQPVRALVAGLLLWYFWPRYTCLRGVSPTASAEEPAGATPGEPARTAFGVGCGVLVFVAWIILVPAEAGDDLRKDATVLGDWPSWAIAGWCAAKTAGFILVTPLAEELAFRGYLMRRLIAADFESVPPGRFTWLSFLGSSAAFGLLHGQWLAGTVAGMGYALVAVRTRRVRDAVVAHAVTNGLLLAQTVITGVWRP